MIIRFSTILLAFHLVFATGGIVLSKHFCANQLDSISIFFANSEKTCGCDNAESDCCSTEVEHLQVEDDYTVSPQLTLPAIPAITLDFFPHLISSISLSHLFDEFSYSYTTFHPGLSEPIFLIVRSLRL